MSIADDLSAAEGEAAAAAEAADTPKGWNPQHERDEDGSGSITTKPYPGDLEIPEHEVLLRDHKLDPEKYEIDGSVRLSQWRGGKGGTWLTAFRFSYCKKGQGKGRSLFDMPLYWSTVNEEPSFTPSAASEGDAEHVAVVAVADYQIGKVGFRGGTPEFMKRNRRALDMALEMLDRDRPEHVIFLDGADAIEGFESGGNPMFTNDLSLPDQVDLYSTVTRKWLNEMSQICDITAATVPGNHSFWRQGKQRLGIPTDDWALKTWAEIMKNPIPGVDFILPTGYDEHIAVDVYDTRIGLVHGCQWAPNRAIDWWEGFSHGSTTLAQAEVLFYGHYHHPNIATGGRTGNQRPRYAIQIPTMDNGSDWFKGLKGSDSDPGFLTAKIRPTGFDLADVNYHLFNETEYVSKRILDTLEVD